MILFGIIIIILFLTGLKANTADSFNSEKVAFLKPFLAIGIMLHHLHGESIFIREFERWGPLIVGVFFFISGYGLSYSLRKNKDYLNKFFFRKIFLKLIFPCSIALLLEIVINWGWTDYNFRNHLFNENGPSLFPNDWFMFALVYCYICFLISGNIQNNKTRLIILCSGPVLLVLFTYNCGWPRNWWATPLAFNVGVIYQQFEKTIIKLNKTRLKYTVNYILLLLFFSSLSFLSFRFGNQITTVASYSLLPVWIITCLTHIDCSKISNNKIIVFLGNISFEIYLLHGIIISFLHHNTILTGMSIVAVTVVLTIMVSIPFKYFVNRSCNIIQKFNRLSVI